MTDNKKQIKQSTPKTQVKTVKPSQGKQSQAKQPSSPDAAVMPSDFLDPIWKYLFPVLIFLSILAQSTLTAIALSIIFIVFSIGRTPAARLKSRVTPLTLCVTLYVLLCLVSGVCSVFGTNALRDSVRILGAFAIFMMAIVRVKDGGGRSILAIIAVCSAVISFLCIDASCLKLTTNAYAALMKLLLCEKDVATMGYEQGVRVTGIFSNANVSAGVIAFGVLTSLYLVQTAATERKRILSFVALGLNALAFWLSFSMGAMVSFALSCFMYIIASGKDRRFPAFLLMVESVFVTVLISFVAISFLGKTDSSGIVPLLCSLICGPVIWALDSFVGRPILKAVTGKGKAVGIVCGVILAFVAVYAAAAFNVTNAASLVSGEQLSRAAYLDPGEYSVSAECSGTAELLVYSQNEAQLMTHTNTALYTGTPDGAAFTVPDSSRVVWFVVTAKDNTQIEKIALSDGSALKLNYPLLPKIAANRLQGLLANQNFIQRLVFFRDGIKLFRQSPVLGGGLGSVEGRLTSVQSFYYESVYIHNHFIQVMDDMGLVGLAVFVLLLLSAVLLLWRERKAQHEPVIFAALASCLVMMIVHSLTEVVWSTGVYQAVVFLIFAALIISYGKPVKLAERKAVGSLAVAAPFAIFIIFGSFIGGSLAASVQLDSFKATTLEEGISAMRRMERLDVYDDEYYKANYIRNALSSNDTDEQMIATEYAEELRATNEYQACSDVAAYYYLQKGMLDQMFDASRTALKQKASSSDAWNAQFDFYRQSVKPLAKEYMPEFLSGVMATIDYLEQTNTGRMEQIAISDVNQQFIDAAKQLSSSGALSSEIYSKLLAFSN